MLVETSLFSYYQFPFNTYVDINADDNIFHFTFEYSIFFIKSAMKASLTLMVNNNNNKTNNYPSPNWH
jgi:hypothetical protein